MARRKIAEFGIIQKALALASVAIYVADENGENTGTLATIYQASTGIGERSNPQTLDADGKLADDCYVEDLVVAAISGITETTERSIRKIRVTPLLYPLPVTCSGVNVANVEGSETAAAASAAAAAASASTATTQASTATSSASTASSAAGFKYTYDTDTAATDPTSGILKFNNATLASATALYISETTGDAQAIAAEIATWDDSTSTIHGKLRMFLRSNPAVFAIFSVTGTLTDNGGWDTLTVAYVTGSGAFADNDLVTIQYLRNGDKGDTGAAGTIPTADGAGTVDAITANFSPDLTLTDKIFCIVISTGANTITNPTFAPDGLTARTIVKNGGVALVAGDTGAAGFPMALEYNLANTRWELLNPANNASKGIANTFIGAQRATVTALSDGATITPDFSANNDYIVQLGGNRALANPTNLVKGQSGSIDVLQDATGSRTLSYAWGWSFPNGTAPTLSTAGCTRDTLYYDVRIAQSATVTISIATPGVVTYTAHGLYTGQKVQITTSGALPTGLTASTTYYAIVNDANSFWLATSLANAAANTKIDTSGSQSGTHTLSAVTINANLAKGFA